MKRIGSSLIYIKLPSKHCSICRRRKIRMVASTTIAPIQRNSFLPEALSRSHVVIVMFMSMITCLPSVTLAFTSPLLVGTAKYTSLHMVKKSSDRAHIERNLEDMMGNDWREFRAKLVAQEQAAVLLRQQQETNMMQTTTSWQPERRPMTTDPELYYHAQDVINHQQNSRPYSSLQQQQQVPSSLMTDMPPTQCVGDLFAGAINIFDGYRISGKSLQCSDPFVSEDELPIMMQKQVTINKHRWAHAIPSPEPGSVLISNTMFHQTVVLVISHCDVKGSTGIVINRPVEGDLLTVSAAHNHPIDGSLKFAFATSPVAYGGPISPEVFSVLHGFGEVEGSIKLCPGVYIGGYEELVDEVRIKRLDPKQCLFVQGHAAWEAGQLSHEIEQGVWHTAAVSADLILRHAGAKVTEDDPLPNDLWGDVLYCMGGEYAAIARKHYASQQRDTTFLP